MKRLLIVAALSAVLTGCTTTKYVEVERVKTDTTYITKWQHDSIWKHDSVYVKEYTQGDTVYLVRDRWHTQYVEKFVRDTCYQHRIDSVPVPYPVIKEVARPLAKTEKAFIALGILSLIGGCIFAAHKIRKYLPLG